MYCPNCDYEMDELSFCPNCNVDPILFIKTFDKSNDLYNLGLERAKDRDLTKACECLVKSLDFNKNNVAARNLLGLVYYEIGHIGDALKQWVISSSIMKEKNLAHVYLDNVQKNSRTLELFNDSIKMYNQALDYLKQKSDDVAIIQLKKAVEINPNFIDALNLLTLCHLIQKEKEKASALAERVLALDTTNPIALKYFKELNPAKVRPEPINTITKSASTQIGTKQNFNTLRPRDKSMFGSSFHLPEIISFSAGFVCAFAILYLLVVPGAVDKKDGEIKKLNQTMLTNEQTYAESKKNLEAQVKKLESDNAKLSQESAILNNRSSLQNVIRAINDAKTLIASEDFSGALAKIEPIKPEGLPADLKKTLEDTKKSLYPKAAQAYFNEGILKFNGDDYADAKVLFNNALKYADPNAPYMDNLIYNLGVIAQSQGSAEEAKAYFSDVVAKFPTSSFARSSQTKLDEME